MLLGAYSEISGLLEERTLHNVKIKTRKLFQGSQIREQLIFLSLRNIKIFTGDPLIFEKKLLLTVWESIAHEEFLRSHKKPLVLETTPRRSTAGDLPVRRVLLLDSKIFLVDFA